MQIEYTDGQIEALAEYREVLTCIIELADEGLLGYEDETHSRTPSEPLHPGQVADLARLPAVVARLRDAELGTYADELEDLDREHRISETTFTAKAERTSEKITDLLALNGSDHDTWVYAPREGDVLSIDLRALWNAYLGWDGAANEAAGRMVAHWIRAGLTEIEGTVTEVMDAATVRVEGESITVMSTAADAEGLIEVALPPPLMESGMLPLSLITAGLRRFEVPGI